MKQTLLTITLALFSMTTQSQIFENTVYADLVYPGCIRAKNKARCMNNKLAQFYLQNLPKDYFEPMEQVDGKIYSYIGLNLLFDENGNFVQTKGESASLDALDMANLKLPRMNMPKDVQNYGVSSSFRSVLRYELILDGDEVKNVFYRPLSSEEISDLMGGSELEITKVAVYPGCKGSDNSKLAKCLQQSIMDYIVENMDDRIANLPGVQESVLSVHIYLTVDPSGRPADVKVVNKHEKIREEVERVIKTLPEIEPAVGSDGSPVPLRLSFQLKYSIRYGGERH